MTAQSGTRRAEDNPPTVVLAVDGGGSKTDVLMLSLTGEVLAHARGRGTNPQIHGVAHTAQTIEELALRVMQDVGDVNLRRSTILLSGIDLPTEIDAFAHHVAGRRWADGDEQQAPFIENDLFALLRAGTDQPDAVAVVCGTGINAVGVRADGVRSRFFSLGDISGDWGGGASLGPAALWHAARAEDGRGPATLLRETVPAQYGMASVSELIEALHFDAVDRRSLVHLTPLMFDAAEAGDEVALVEVQRQSEEIATMTLTTLRRLSLLEAHVPIVLGGGIIAASRPVLMDPLLARIAALAPHATPVLVTAPPIVGSGLLSLEAAHAEHDAIARAELELRGSVALVAQHGQYVSAAR